MATRPTKTGGNTTYVAEVAAGQTTIRASEVDADLNELYTNLTNGNVATGAAIATAKLADDAGITTAKLGALSVTTAKLAALAVTTAKLALNSTQNNLATGTILTAQTITAEAPLVTLGSITTRGGLVVLFGTAAMTLNAGAAGTVTLRLKRNGTTLFTYDYAVSVTGASVSFPIPTPIAAHVPAAAAAVYSLTATTTSGTITTAAVNAGFYHAVELA